MGIGRERRYGVRFLESSREVSPEEQDSSDTPVHKCIGVKRKSSDNLLSTKTKNPQTDNRTSTPGRDPVPPHHGPRPIIDMVLSWAKKKKYRTVRVLLNTGSTAALLDKDFVLKYKIPTIKRDTPLQILNFSNEVVPGVGKFFTVPFMLQHKKHFAAESFEICHTLKCVIIDWVTCIT
jgi:hypothetical protein